MMIGRYRASRGKLALIGGAGNAELGGEMQRSALCVGDLRLCVHLSRQFGHMKILNHKDAGYAAFVSRLRRRAIPEDAVRDLVGDIISAVALKGDDALVELTHRFDGAKLSKKGLFITENEFADAAAAVS